MAPLLSSSLLQAINQQGGGIVVPRAPAPTFVGELLNSDGSSAALVKRGRLEVLAKPVSPPPIASSSLTYSSSSNAGDAPVPMLAARKDAPRVAFSTRAEPKLAAAATASEEAKAAALEDYEKDKLSATAPGARSSAFNTWKKYHEEGVGDQGPGPGRPSPHR